MSVTPSPPAAFYIFIAMPSIPNDLLLRECLSAISTSCRVGSGSVLCSSVGSHGWS